MLLAGCHLTHGAQSRHARQLCASLRDIQKRHHRSHDFITPVNRRRSIFHDYLLSIHRCHPEARCAEGSSAVCNCHESPGTENILRFFALLRMTSVHAAAPTLRVTPISRPWKSPRAPTASPVPRGRRTNRWLRCSRGRVSVDRPNGSIGRTGWQYSTISTIS